jgi:RNA polymerase sigma-70 factor (ECF subfamily)
MPWGAADPIAQQQARFHALVLPHLDRLLGFARRRTTDVADAEDAVQEACIRAWAAFGDLRDDALARAWLYRILRNVLADQAAAQQRRPLVSLTKLEEQHEEVLAGEEDALFREVAERLDAEQLRTALAMVPEEFARAVELHDIDGFKYREIADIEGVPIGTIMSRISRGRRLLAGAMANLRATPRSAQAAVNDLAGRTRRPNDRGHHG